MNERTHFFIKIYLSHFILEREMFLVCDRWVETRTDFYLDPSSSSTIAAFLSHLGWVAAQPWVTEGPSPLSGAGSHSVGILSPTDSSDLCPGYIIVYVHLLPLFFRLFTQMHLLIDGSFKGQYITPWPLGVKFPLMSWHAIKTNQPSADLSLCCQLILVSFK